ncbi:MAG: methyltransferase [Candidatus Limiplasma sp.]|nr:methyltransferase [Candidatus Limiplasma sp.]
MGLGTQNRRFGAARSIIELSESKRLEIQKELFALKTTGERRILGQFATPAPLARDIISFGLHHMLSGQKIRFLDPAFGTGVFYSALLGETNPSGIETATAIEIDPLFVKAAKELWVDYGINIINADFTDIKPDERYNFLICNPPYVRHQLISSDIKMNLINETERKSGIRLSGLAGLYCHFMLQSIQWMEEGALAGWLIPSEFMDVNYGKALKNFLLSEVELFHVHRFCPNDVQFDDALVSSVVVWFRNQKPKQQSVLFSFGGTLHAPRESRDINVSVLREEAKWTRFPRLPQRFIEISTPKLKDYFDVKRGIATGGNSFFILDESQIQKLCLPMQFFIPVLPSPRYLVTAKVESDESGIPILSRRLFLLDCRLEESRIKEMYPRLWDYLEHGRTTVGNGYLCRNRKCWYLQEQRESPLLVFTYIGRRKNERESAFRFILNNSKATVTNSYLALYPKKRISDILANSPDLKRRVWQLLNQLSPDNLDNEGRIYGGGMQKIEPKELLNIDVPFLRDLFG